MKKILIALAVLLAGFSVSANAQSFQGVGDQQLSAGVSGGLNDYSNVGFQINYNYGVYKFISVGGQVNLNFGDYAGFYIGPRANIHLLNIINPSLSAPFDWYAGLTMGVNVHNGAHFGIGGYLGGQWDFAENFGLRLEVGSNYMLGVAFRL